MMNLRHKKPINPYTGQANHDSSSAHDEDFEKNHTPSRRQKFVKQKPVTEQTKKYAEILLEFTAVVNQNFRTHLKKTACNNPPQPQKDKIQPNLALSAKPNIFVEQKAHGKTEVVSKQQQKIRKPESLSNKFPPPTKKIRKERSIQQEPPKKKQTTVSPIARQPPLSQTKPTPVIDLTSNQKIQQSPNLPQKMPSMQSMMQNPFMSMMNPAMFNPMMYQMAMMMGQSNLQDLKNDPNVMSYLAQFQNLFGMMPMNMQNMQNVQPQNQGQNQNQQKKNSYIPFHQLPFLNNESKQAFSRQLRQFQQAQQAALNKATQAQTQNFSQKIPNIQQQGRRVFPPAPPQQTQKSSQIPKTRRNDVEIGGMKKNPSIPEIPISNKKDSQAPKPQIVNAENQNGQKNGSGMLPNFNRRASNHVSIAYNIHFHHLRQKGMIGNNLTQMQSAEELKIIDPTYPARKIRERKNSDNITGINKHCEITPS